jgi:hypothetical protein
MWLNPGIVGQSEVETDQQAAKPFPLGGRSLQEVAKEYVLLNPFPLPLVYPEIEIDLLTEATKTVGYPTERSVIILETEIFQYGQRGAAMGVPGNLVVPIPIAQWPHVQAFLHSVVFVAADKRHVAIRTQTLSVVDPTISQSRPIASIDELLVSVCSVVIDAGDVAFVALQNKATLPSALVYGVVSAGKDMYLDALCDAFVSGESDPHAAASKLTETTDAVEDSQ